MLVFDSGLTTSVTLQKTNIPNPEASDTDWITDTGFTFTGSAGGGGSEIQGGEVDAAIYRLRFNTTAGAGNVRVYAHHKSEK